jgi:acyl-CoA synthetase (AMP-forming)/AMP-acid ligase II
VTLDDPQVFTPELWATHARYQPERTALACGTERRTWRDFNRNLNRVANALLERGVQRGDRVAVLMSNSIEMIEAMFGVVKAGACVVPLSTLLLPEQIAALLNDAGAIGLFASFQTRRASDAAWVQCASLRQDLRVMFGPSAPDWIALEVWLSSNDAEPDVTYRMEDDFNIIYSSGTTGIPKGIVQTHRARQHFAYSNALELRFDNTSIALATTALYSNGSWFMLLAPFFVGATAIVLDSFDAEKFFSTVARERITHTFMVPTQFIALLDSPLLPRADLSSLKMVLSAGSPLREDIKTRVLRDITPSLFELYGFAEGLATLIRPEEIWRKPRSVGKPLVGFDLRIIDKDGQVAPTGELGEIVGYGAGLMREYYRKPDVTAESIWRDERGRTFLRSGDIGYLDKEGFLYIVDRKKDMILSGGLNVFPADIETIVAQHADIADVCVIGIPHAKWGEVPLALVVLHRGRNPDLIAVRDWANERLSKPQRLSGIEVRTEFPRNALGKVLKRQLREPYWRESRG